MPRHSSSLTLEQNTNPPNNVLLITYSHILIEKKTTHVPHCLDSHTKITLSLSLYIRISPHIRFVQNITNDNKTKKKQKTIKTANTTLRGRLETEFKSTRIRRRSALSFSASPARLRRPPASRVRLPERPHRFPGTPAGRRPRTRNADSSSGTAPTCWCAPCPACTCRWPAAAGRSPRPAPADCVRTQRVW